MGKHVIETYFGPCDCMIPAHNALCRGESKLIAHRFDASLLSVYAEHGLYLALLTAREPALRKLRSSSRTEFCA